MDATCTSRYIQSAELTLGRELQLLLVVSFYA